MIIGNNVSHIGSGAFEKNKLTSVSIPNSVIKIDDKAFTKNSIKNVNLSKDIKNYKEIFDDEVIVNQK